MEHIGTLPKNFRLNNLKYYQDKIETFVESSYNDYYVRKRNANPDKIKKDIWIGKLAEVGVSQYIMSIGGPMLEPDFNIYSGKNKNWDADLPYSKNSKYTDIHVKACDRETVEYLKRKDVEDYSWTFQWSNNDGRGGKDKIFEKNDRVALVYVPDTYSEWVRIFAILDVFDIVRKLKDPVSPKLKNIKKCLYYKDLINESK